MMNQKIKEICGLLINAKTHKKYKGMKQMDAFLMKLNLILKLRRSIMYVNIVNMVICLLMTLFNLFAMFLNNQTPILIQIFIIIANK